jgi:hypothetical protein
LQFWPSLPSLKDGFAGLVDFDVFRFCDSLHWQREAVTLLDVENRVVGENEWVVAVLLVSGILRLVFVVVRFALELFVEDDLGAFLSLANGASQFLRLFLKVSQKGAV